MTRTKETAVGAIKQHVQLDRPWRHLEARPFPTEVLHPQAMRPSTHMCMPLVSPVIFQRRLSTRLLPRCRDKSESHLAFYRHELIILARQSRLNLTIRQTKRRSPIQRGRSTGYLSDVRSCVLASREFTICSHCSALCTMHPIDCPVGEAISIVLVVIARIHRDDPTPTFRVVQRSPCFCHSIPERFPRSGIRCDVPDL